MSERPTGTVTFLFTDLEGSTRLWQRVDCYPVVSRTRRVPRCRLRDAAVVMR